MKKNVAAIVCLALLIGCKESDLSRYSKQEIKTLNAYKLSPVADSFLRNYVKHVSNAKAYAIYFDKKEEEEYRLTVAPFEEGENYLNTVQALNYFLLNDSILVFLYSGIEDFIVRDTTISAEVLSKPNLARSWSLVNTKDTSYVIEGDVYPFMKLTLKPTIYFKPPDGSVK